MVFHTFLSVTWLHFTIIQVTLSYCLITVFHWPHGATESFKRLMAPRAKECYSEYTFSRCWTGPCCPCAPCWHLCQECASGSCPWWSQRVCPAHVQQRSQPLHCFIPITYHTHLSRRFQRAAVSEGTWSLETLFQHSTQRATQRQRGFTPIFMQMW